MAGNNTKVWMEHGGDQLNVDDGGSININAGGMITVDGAQQAHVADLATGASGPTIVAKVNAILVRLENVGILATS